jgi:hypothetical protein
MTPRRGGGFIVSSDKVDANIANSVTINITNVFINIVNNIIDSITVRHSFSLGRHRA